MRETAAARDKFEILANRDACRVTELEKSLKLAKSTAGAALEQQSKERRGERDRMTQEMADVQEELLAVQKKYRAADMARLKSEDEIVAMNDRIESLRALSKEREAALVQQLQTFRKTADKSSVTVRLILFYGYLIVY